MKRLCCFLALATLTVSSHIVADQNPTSWTHSGKGGNVHYGPTTISNQTMENLTVYGTTQISNSKVTNLATFKGPINARRTTFNRVDVDGIAKFENVKVTQELYINGPINAYNSSFEAISIASSELALSNCTVTNLFVRKNNNPLPQRVYLDKNTKIQSIKFEKKGGSVVLGDSTVVIGNLEGGTSSSLTTK